MTDLMVILVLLLLVGGASAYIVKARKRGVKCIGCPDGAKCASAQGGCAENCSGCCGGCTRRQDHP